MLETVTGNVSDDLEVLESKGLRKIQKPKKRKKNSAEGNNTVQVSAL